MLKLWRDCKCACRNYTKNIGYLLNKGLLILKTQATSISAHSARDSRRPAILTLSSTLDLDQ